MQNKKGFTLMELLAVVVIIGILTSVALPQYRRAIQRAKVTEAVAMMRTIYDSEERLAAELGYKDLLSLASSPDSNKLIFERLDMFDRNTTSCSIDGTEMTCSNFVYSISNPTLIQAFPRWIEEGMFFSLSINGDGVTGPVCNTYLADVCDIYSMDKHEYSAPSPHVPGLFEEEEG